MARTTLGEKRKKKGWPNRVMEKKSTILSKNTAAEGGRGSGHQYRRQRKKAKR